MPPLWPHVVLYDSSIDVLQYCAHWYMRSERSPLDRACVTKCQVSRQVPGRRVKRGETLGGIRILPNSQYHQ